MSKLRLSIACWDYDRTRALLEDRIPIDGIELNYLNLPVEETFFRMLRHAEFEVAELSLSSYTLSLFRENPPFIAIPIFPSRFFRHSCIYVNADCGIREPKDLIGKRIGNPEYQMTAPVWIRGILSDEYGVPVTSATYLSGGEEEPGRPEKLALSLPPQFRLESIPPTKTLSQMIESGEIDALYTARAPSTFMRGSGKVQRLFPDFAGVERAYYLKTRIFPIMHTVVIRREVYEQNRWVAQSLMDAFEQAKALAMKAYNAADVFFNAPSMIPWFVSLRDKNRALMGDDFWPYGIAENRSVLETCLRYHREQGILKRSYCIEDLFAPETLS